ncbi:MAG: invasin domain 3-containing protein [Balneolaceae bacterium]
MQADPESLPVGDASTVTIELKDGAGNEISGLSESEFTITVSGEGTADPVNETSVSGIYEFNVNNTTAEQVTVEVTVSGVILSDTPQITFNAGDPDDIAVEDQPGSTIAGQVIPGSPSVEVTDEFNNPVPGAEVTVTEQSGQAFASGENVLSTNSSGLAVFDDLVINAAGQYNLVFTVNGSVTVTSNAFTVEPADADPDSTIADVPNGAATNPTTITITVEDSFGNRVEGVADDLEVSIGGANSGTAVEPISDDGDGIYSTSYTPTSSGEDEITITLNETGIAGSPYTSDVSTSDAENVIVETEPIQTVAGQAIEGPPAARVADTGDNDVPGVEVTADLQSGSFDSGTTSVDTDGSGIATFTDLVINIAGSYTMEFDAVGVSEDAVSQEFEVLAADADELSVNNGNNQTATVTEALADPFVVEVTDAFGNPVEGETVTFAISTEPTDASGTSLTETSVDTDADGFAATQLTLGSRTGTYQVTASATDLEDVTFTAEAEAGPATAYEFDTISSPQTAGQPFTISLTALDDQGNTADSYGETVDLSASQGSVSPASAEFTNGTSSLDVALDEAGGDITISATDGTISETSNAFDVQSGGVDAESSTVSADPEQLQAGETSQLTIELRDESNNPVEGLSDGDFSIDVNGAATAGAVSESGTAGTYTADIDNQTAETITATVTANGATLADTPSIEFSAADANAVVEISGNNQSGTVTQQLSEDFVVQVEDEFNNPVEGETVTFSISGQPTGASGQSLSVESASTDGEGLAATRLTLGDEPGTYTVDGTVSGLNTISFNAEAQTGDASQMTVSTQPEETTAGGAITPAPAVTITDDADNPIEGVTVTVSEQGGYSFDSGSTNEVTNASGIAEFSDLVIQAADSYSLVFDADAAGISNVSSNLFDVVPAEADPAVSSATVPDGVAGDATTITIDVVDEFNNPVTGEAGNLSASISDGPNSGASFASIEDNGDGTYTTSYTPENDGSDQIVVTLDGAGINGSPFTSDVSTGDVSASNSEVTADPTTLQAGNSSLVSVDLRDGSNNPITGLTSTDFSVDITDAGSASTISESSTDGVYQFTVSNEKAEEVPVTVTASGTTLQDTPDITFTAADPDQMIISTEPDVSTAGEPIDGPPAVTITDEYDNPVPNAEVDVTEQGGEPFGTGSTSTLNTDAQGIATFSNLAIETVGQYNLVFSSAGVTNRTSNAFDVESAAPDAAQTTADVPNGSAGDQTNITITVRDEFGNRVEGVDGQITVEVQGDNAGETVAEITDDGNGVYTTGYTPESTGTDDIVIQVNSAGIQGSPFESSVDNSDAENISISQEPLETVAGNSIAGPPTVVVTDGFGNTVSGVEVTVSEQSGTDFDAGELTVSTDGSGIAEFSDLRIDATGTYTLEFDAVGVATDAVSGIFEVIAADGDPDQTTAAVPDGTSNQSTTITVTVRDQFGNTVEGAEGDLSASVTAGPNDTEVLSGFQDDGGGSYSASYTPISSGTDEITITLGGSPISDSPYTSEVSAGDPTSLQVTQEPSETTAGNTITPAPAVELTDSEGNGVSGVNVTATLSSNTFTLGSTTTVSTNDDGLAVFDNLVTETAETGYNITFDANAPGVDNIDSGPFDVTAATASTINEVSGNGQSAEVSTDLAEPFTVEVEDAFGNRVANETVEFSITDTPDGATGQSLTNASIQSDSEGLASTVMTLGNITGSYTTQASLGSETVSFSADATPGDATSYNFEEITSPQTASTGFSITLQALDGEANVDTSFSGTADLSTTAGTITPASAEFTDGVATVSVTVTDAGTDQTITADDGLISATSNGFDVNPGSVSATASTANASSPHTADGSDASTVTIDLADENGNVISGLADTDFTVDVGDNATAGTINETATDGTYEFSVTDTTAETVTVSIIADGTTLEDEPQIEFQPGPATSYQFDEISTPQTVDEPFSITITAQDDYGNTATGFTGTAPLSTTAGTIEPANATFTDGVATVSVTVTDTGTDQTITAETTESLAATSNTFDVENP